MTPNEFLRSGDSDAALDALQALVRKSPGDARLRIFLFQLLCIRGEWKRAVTQLKVCAELDKSAESMARAYREAIICEVYRERVFAGDKVPLVFGQPQEWVALMFEALKADAAGQVAQAADLRGRAFELAPATAGEVDGTRFEWIADADTRFGPLLEVLVNGKYYWMPFSAIRALRCDAPGDLRDAVWTAANLTLTTGGEVAALIPTRYPGTVAEGSAAERLARETRWVALAGDGYAGIGQRLLATDSGDVALMDLRVLRMDGTGDDG